MSVITHVINDLKILLFLYILNSRGLFFIIINLPKIGDLHVCQTQNTH